MNKKLPKIVWIYWAQGWEHATGTSNASRRSWERRNPDWDVRAIDAKGVSSLLGEGWGEGLIPANQDQTSRSNFVRLELLSRFGGVWADATTFSVVPLSEWIEPHLNQGFFAFSSPGGDRLLSTWFLAAKPGNLIVEKWRIAVVAHWRERDDDKFHWVHRIFKQVYENDPAFARTWDQVNHISAQHPLHMGPGKADLLNAPPTADIINVVEQRFAYVAKLTNRANCGEPTPDTLNAWLCDNLSRSLGDDELCR